MAPLILHNVPDEELYVGDDGIQRPYAVIFPHQQDATTQGSVRTRRTVAETGAFGKSARRSRSRTGTPVKRGDPTIQAADKVFSDWFQKQGNSASPDQIGDSPPSKSATAQATGSQAVDENRSSPPRFVVNKVPTEVVLRGYRSPEQQYAAIDHYEQLAGRICEDYARDPPIENRRYKSEIRDPAYTRRGTLTPEERAKVNKVDGGEHWVKVTFESSEAADAAMFASPQSILGHLVYAEPYYGIPIAHDEAVLDRSVEAVDTSSRQSRSKDPITRRSGQRASGSTVNRPFGATPFDSPDEFSPPHSYTSSKTAESGTVATSSDSATVSSGTMTGAFPAFATEPERPSVTQHEQPPNPDNAYCRAIPSVRKVKLQPVDAALLPQPSYAQRMLSRVPLMSWFSGSMIGNEVPRMDSGEFDWDKASLYWKVIWWLDATFGLFGGEILTADKDD